MEIQKELNRILSCIVTCCYLGYLPYAPGTYASAFGSLLIFLFPSIFANVLFCVGLVLFSVLSVSLFRYEGKDPGYIVIDEFAGICVAMAGHSVTLMNTIIGFILFRVFDILKPFPIKQTERLKGAWGIVADDVVAGLFASIILVIMGRFL